MSHVPWRWRKPHLSDNFMLLTTLSSTVKIFSQFCSLKPEAKAEYNNKLVYLQLQQQWTIECCSIARKYLMFCFISCAALSFSSSALHLYDNHYTNHITLQPTQAVNNLSLLSPSHPLRAAIIPALLIGIINFIPWVPTPVSTVPLITWTNRLWPYFLCLSCHRSFTGMEETVWIFPMKCKLAVNHVTVLHSTHCIVKFQICLSCFTGTCWMHTWWSLGVQPY